MVTHCLVEALPDALEGCLVARLEADQQIDAPAADHEVQQLGILEAVGRDQAATEQAQRAMSDVLKRYPKTEYAIDARLKLDMVQDQLAKAFSLPGRQRIIKSEKTTPVTKIRARGEILAR